MGNCSLNGEWSGDRARRRATLNYSSQEAPVPQPQTLPQLHGGSALNFVDTVDEEHLVTCGDDGVVSILNWCSGSVVAEWRSGAASVSRVACGRVRCDCYSSSRDNVIRHWRRGQEDPVQELKGHTLSINALAVSCDETRLCSGSRDYTVRIWDIASQTQISKSKINRNVVTCCRWVGSADPMVLAQSSEDLTVRIWDTRGPALQCGQVLRGFVYFPISMDTSPDGQFLLTGAKGFSAGNGADVKLWDRRKAAGPLHQMSGHTMDVKGVGFLPTSNGLNDGRSSLASASKDQTIKIWDQTTGDQTAEWNIGGGMFTSMASAHHDGRGAGSDGGGNCMLLCAVTFWGSIYVYSKQGISLRQHHVASNPALDL